MNLSRREMMLASIGLLVSGCASNTAELAMRPGAQWPSVSTPKTPGGVAVPPPPAAATTPAVPAAAPARPLDGLGPLSRHHWTRTGPIAGRVNPIVRASRITVHHEGWQPVWYTDQRVTAARIEEIRATHVRDRGWGDIGYHYIVDRAGRVWEGRDIRYQGAHVSQHNEQNIGVMCLGNFEQQSPSDAQLNGLTRTLQALTRQHRIAPGRVYTHRELMPTACPGRNLQPRVASIRGRYLA